MRKYYLTYALFLLPALTAALFFNDGSAISIVAAWAFALLLLIGFAVTTYLAAYPFPRQTFALILFYTGLNLVIYYLFYTSVYGTALYNILRDYGGALSYVPLGVFVDTFGDLRQNIEVYVILSVTLCMLLGFFAALVKRRVKPNPYRPKIG